MNVCVCIPLALTSMQYQDEGWSCQRSAQAWTQARHKDSLLKPLVWVLNTIRVHTYTHIQAESALPQLYTLKHTRIV